MDQRADVRELRVCVAAKVTKRDPIPVAAFHKPWHICSSSPDMLITLRRHLESRTGVFTQPPAGAELRQLPVSVCKNVQSNHR